MAIESGHNCVVLAAGGSLRLGQPKQLLRRAGESLIHRCARLAAATRPHRLLIVLGGAAQRIRPVLADIEAELIENVDWRAGLSTSLNCAADALSADPRPSLLLGCDQPALELRHLQALLRASAGASSGCAAILHQGLPGIPAVVSAELLAQSAAMHGDRGLRDALRAVPLERLGRLEFSDLQFDIDDADDLAAAIAAGWIDPQMSTANTIGPPIQD